MANHRRLYFPTDSDHSALVTYRKRLREIKYNDRGRLDNIVVSLIFCLHLVLFCQKRASKICKKSSNCAHICLTITKITITGLSKFNCERQFIVIFVIVKHNWKIYCGFLIVDGLVFRNLGHRDLYQVSNGCFKLLPSLL